MEMTGKELPIYRFDQAPSHRENIVAHGDINGEPCHLSVIRVDGDHILVATVNEHRVAISGNEILGAAASLALKEDRNG